MKVKMLRMWGSSLFHTTIQQPWGHWMGIQHTDKLVNGYFMFIKAKEQKELEELLNSEDNRFWRWWNSKFAWHNINIWLNYT